jgi:hypothetical protein
MVEGCYNHKLFKPELQPRTIKSSIDNFLPWWLKSLGLKIWVEMSVELKYSVTVFAIHQATAHYGALAHMPTW